MSNPMLSSSQALLQMLYLRLRQQFGGWAWKIGYVGFALAIFVSASFMKASLQNSSSFQAPVRQAAATWSRPAAESSLLRGVPIEVQANGAAAADAQKALAYLGAKTVKEDGDLRLTQEKKTSGEFWVVSFSPHPQVLKENGKLLALAQLKSTLESYPKEREARWRRSLPSPPSDTRVLGWELRDPLTKTLAARLVAGMVLMMWMWPVLNLFAGFIGLEWDMRRTDGSLEPWTLVPTPLWVMYGAQILTAALHLSVFALVGMLVTALVIPSGFIGAPLACALLVMTFGLSCFIGSIGMLSTMIFRHRYGRMFARMVLAPTSMVTISLLMVALGKVNDAGGYIIAALLFEWLALLALGAGVALVFGSVLVLWAVEKRIGIQREGLRML